MKVQSKSGIKQAVRSTLEKYDIHDVTPSSLRRILLSLGYEVVRLTVTDGSDANAKLADCGITPSDLRGGSRSVFREGKRYVFLAADVIDGDILRLLARELGYIVLCEPKDGLYGGDRDDDAAADEYARLIESITKHSLPYNILVFHPSAVVGTAAALVAAAVGGIALFGSPSSLLSPRAKEAEDRMISVMADAPVQQGVMQEPLQIDTESKTPHRLNELEGVPTKPENTAEPESAPSSGFIPLSPTDELPGYDAAVTENGTGSAERIIPAVSPTDAAGERTVQAFSEEAAAASTLSTPSGYVATGSGTKYHVPDCSYVKNKTTRSVSIEDIYAGKYTACSRCIK